MRFIEQKYIIILIGLVLLTSSITAISYLSSQNIFYAEILDINTSQIPYSLNLLLENRIGEELEFEIKITSLDNSILVFEDILTCSNICEFGINFSRVFFDTHNIYIETQYNSKSYTQELEFNFEQYYSNSNLKLNDAFIVSSRDTSNITGTLELEELSNAVIEIFPTGFEQLKQHYIIECKTIICDFNIQMNNIVFIGEYTIRVFLEKDFLQQKFRIYS